MPTHVALVLASALVGLLVGLTGVGGGALMTPMLILAFGVAPSAAISADLVAALFIKTTGAVIHWRLRGVRHDLVRYLCYGSLPAAVSGTLFTHLWGHRRAFEHDLATGLGVVLVLAGLSLARRSFTRRAGSSRRERRVQRVATVVVGALGGFMVAVTSVGAGSLVVAALFVLYPALENDQLVGTDLAQSVPLALTAALGTLLFGHVDLALVAVLVAGSLPGVVVGALASSRWRSVIPRRIVALVVVLAGLRDLGASLRVLAGCSLALVALVALAAETTRRARRDALF